MIRLPLPPRGDGLLHPHPDTARPQGLPPMTKLLRVVALAGLAAPGLVSCSLIHKDIAWPEDMTGKNLVGVSSGWAFAEATVVLENGQGGLATPPNDVGKSKTDLDPVFGLGLKYFRYMTNNFLLGAIIEHRIFDPESTRPLSADVDLDDFGTTHLVLEARYQLDPIDDANRLRPFAGVQFGFVPEVKADGVARYGANAFSPAVTEEISLEGSEFFTLGFVAGASYLIQQGLTADFGVFYEYALNPTKDQLVLDPYPGVPGFEEPSTYDGELYESGIYLTWGLTWTF